VRCTAVGEYADASGTVVPLAERWDGRNWTVQQAPIAAGAQSSHLNAVSCAAATACTAVGDIARELPGRDQQTFPLAERWDGTAWTVQQAVEETNSDVSLKSVSCPSTSFCAAVGSGLVNPAQYNGSTAAESWDGTRWTINATQENGAAIISELLGVSCATSTSCTAVGDFATAADIHVTLVEHY
jgi:hypothetical protein